MLPRESALPFSRPEIGEEEIDEVVRVLRSGWITTGPLTAQFEKEFAAAHGARHALGVLLLHRRPARGAPRSGPERRTTR